MPLDIQTHSYHSWGVVKSYSSVPNSRPVARGNAPSSKAWRATPTDTRGGSDCEKQTGDLHKEGIYITHIAFRLGYM